MPAAPGKPLFSIPVRWLLTGGTVVTGPRPRTALQVEALHDAQILTVRVDYPGLPPGASPEAVLVTQPAGEGAATLRPFGDALAAGREDLALGGELSRQDVLEDLLAYNRCPYPQDYWCWAGCLDVPRGLCVGVVVRSDVYAACRVTVGGR